jgi:hypothetical protein
MGRWYYHRKATVEESCAITVFKLKKLGMFTGCQSSKITWTSSRTGKETSVGVTVYTTADPHIRFMYTITDGKNNNTDYDYIVSLVTTDCNFGGVRYWFGCPLCGRRAAVLYLAPGDVHFECRLCNNLSYWSRNRCKIESWGHFSREKEELQSQIKRWTWQGRPTRKVRRLQALERKVGILSGPIMAQTERLQAKLS